MSRYIIGPDVAIQLAGSNASIHNDHQMLAPSLIRSQVLSRLYYAEAKRLVKVAPIEALF